MSGPPVPKPRGSLKTQDEDEIAAAPPTFKPPPPRPKNKPVAETSSNEPTRDEYVSTDQIDLELDSSKDKVPVKSVAGRVAPPVPKGDQSPKSVSESPKRPAPAPPKHSMSMDPSTMESKLAETNSAPSTALPSGPKHTRSISTGAKPGADEQKRGHNRNVSVDESSPKITPKRVAPPPPGGVAKGDKRQGKPDDGGKPAPSRSESCQSFDTQAAQSKLKELKPKDRKAPAVPSATKQPQSSPKPPQKQSSFESQVTKGAVTPPQRASPKAPRKFTDSESKSTRVDNVDGGEPNFNTAKERIKKAGVALPLALLKEQAEAKKKSSQQQSQSTPGDTMPTAGARTNEPTISYMDSPMAGSDDSSRKVKFSRQLKTWLTYPSEEYDRANNVNVVQSAVLYELEKLIEKMHIYSVQLNKSDNVLGMHIRSQDLNSTPEVGGKILGIFISNVTTNSPAALNGSIIVGDLLLEVDGKPMIGSSRSEAMRILYETSNSVQLTLGRPSSPIMKESTSSTKDEGDQVASTSAATKSTSPSPIDDIEHRMRPRTRSVTPDKPKPPPVVHAKPPLAPKQGIPPKPPRVKPRTHVSSAHITGEQREGETPTPPNSRDDTSSSGSEHPPPPQPLARRGSGDRILPSPVRSFSTKTPPSPVREPGSKPAFSPVTDKVPSYPARPPSVEKRSSPEHQVTKKRSTPDQQVTNSDATVTRSVAKHAVVDSVSSQKPVEAAIKPTGDTSKDIDVIKAENNKLLKDKEEMQAELKAHQLKISGEQAQKEAEWKSTIARLENQLQEKSDLLSSAEQMQKEEMEKLRKSLEESQISTAESMEQMNAKIKETHHKYMTLLADMKEMEMKHLEAKKELAMTRNSLLLSEETLKSKETEYQEKIETLKREKPDEVIESVVDESEIEKLKEELAAVTVEKDKEMSELHNELEKIKEKQTENDKELDLREELKVTKEKLLEKDETLTSVEADLKSAQSCMDQMQGRNRGLIDQLKEVKDENDKELVDLREELKVTKEKLLEKDETLTSVEADLKSAQSCMDQMQGRNRGLIDQLKEVKDDSKNKEERVIELAVEAKKYKEEVGGIKSEMEALKEEVKKHKEDLEKKDAQISKYETQLEELQSAAKTVKRTEDKDEDREYKNIDTSEGDNYANFDVSAPGEDYTNIDTTAEGSSYTNINTSDLEKDEQQDEECGPEDYGPEDYGAPYVNVKVDKDDEDETKKDEAEKKTKIGEDEEKKDEVEKKNDEEDEIEKKKDEESDDIPIVGFDCIAKTATITSTSQLSRAKVSTTLRRKPPSRGLLRRAAEESGSQGDLFGVSETEEGDYVNMPVNPAVREPRKPKEEDEKPTDDKQEEEKVENDTSATSTEDKPEVNDKSPEDKSNKPPPPVADKPPPVANKSPVAVVRSRHKVGGIAMLPVTAQMEELLSRKRLQTESALQKEPEETRATRFASVAKAPPVVKKKPVRAPLKSADFIDQDSKSGDLSSGKARSLENLVSACDDEVTGSTSVGSDKLSKRISASMSVEDFKNSPPPPTAPIKPPAVKARKLIPGGVKLITPMPRTGKVELNEEKEDKPTPADKVTTSDNATPTDDQDKQDVNVDTPQPPDSPSDITDAPPDDDKDRETPDKEGETLGDKQQDNQKQDDDGKQSEATGGSENIDILLLPEWNTEQVCVWLQRCGLGELTTGIKLGNVTGKILMDLDSSKMKGLGIFNANDRKTLQKDIKSLKSEHDRLKKAEKKKSEAEKKLAKKEEKKRKNK